MWALALTLVAALPPLTDFPRPDGTVKTPLVQVLLRDGQVTITPSSGKTFDARTGMKLGAADTIAVGPNAWVAIHILGNDHVVRLDDDLSLRVAELALLKAPKHSQSLEQQFNRLVTTKEQDAGGRLIGWNVSQTAANVPNRVVPDEGGGGKVKTVEVMPRPESKESGRPPGGVTTKEAEPSPSPPPPSPAPAQATPAQRPASTPPMPPADATLTACVRETLEPLGADAKKVLGKTIVVRVKLKADGTLLVQLPRGVNAPPCALSWFSGKPGIGPKWSDVTVTLP